MRTRGFGTSHPDAERNSRNLRDVWTIPTQPYKGAHFATYPKKLVEPCVKAGSSAKGCCPKCGAPWEREVTGAVGGSIGHAWLDHKHDAERGNFKTESSKGYRPGITTGWSPSCSCPSSDPVPCTVMDIFNGSGTTGVVAYNLGRRYIGIELNQKYIELAHRRIVEGIDPDFPEDLEGSEESAEKAVNNSTQPV